MPYLFGDSTPFPLDDNFIETLRDATDACVALLAIDEKLDELFDKQDVARSEADAEQARLEAVATSVVKSLEPHIGGVESASAGQVAVRVLNAARGVLEGARSEVSNRRDRELREVESALVSARGSVPRALESLLARRDLPDMTWKVSWTAGLGEAPATAFAEGRTDFALKAKMDLDVAPASLFARPVRVSDLEKGVDIRLPEPGGWLRRQTRLSKIHLDGYYLTEATLGEGRASMMLRKSNKHPSSGVEIIVRATAQNWPSARRVDEMGKASDEATVLDGLEAADVHRLWSKVEGHLRTLEKKRSRLVEATLDGKPIDRPAVLAQRIIGSLAPLVREMRRRSSSAGELVLKKDLGAGRREEIWIAKSDLVGKYLALSAARRATFDPFGLDLVQSVDEDEVTHELSDIEMDVEEQTIDRTAAAV